MTMNHLTFVAPLLLALGLGGCEIGDPGDADPDLEEDEDADPLQPIAWNTNYCGDGYVLIDRTPLTSDSDDRRPGYLNLYKKFATGRYCATTTHNLANWGDLRWTTVFIDGDPSTSTTYDSDSDDYRYYAGPVRTRRGTPCGDVIVTGHMRVGSAYYGARLDGVCL